MLALKKKKEAAAAAEAAAAQEPQQEKLSLLGIGGKKMTNATENGTGKKRTPGEIRIQKGTVDCSMDTIVAACMTEI
jgi:hypothetical protein